MIEYDMNFAVYHNRFKSFPKFRRWKDFIDTLYTYTYMCTDHKDLILCLNTI